MSSYTIDEVSTKVEEYEGQFGPGKSYRVKFKESGDTIVQLSQLASTPAPKGGDVLEGTIDMSGNFGPKFKKSFAPRSGSGGGGYRGGGGGGKADPKTMYTAYAKDIVVALINQAILPDADNFDSIYEKALVSARRGGLVLMNEKPNSDDGNDDGDDAPPPSDEDGGF